MATDEDVTLDRDSKKGLRELGWRRLNHKKAKRPSGVSSRYLLDLSDEEAADALTVQLERYV